MKTKHSALAIAATTAGLLAAGSAQAVTLSEDENSKFDLYGRVHLQLENSDTAGTAFNNSSSRLGFRASHEVAPGLTAFSRGELRFDADEKTRGRIQTRNSYLGVKGSLGSLYAGNFDAMYNNQISDVINVDENEGFRSFNTGSQRAHGDTIAFDSAVFGGFNFGVSAKLQSDDTTTAAVDEEEINTQAYVSYTLGAAKLALGYDQANEDFIDGGEADSIRGVAAAIDVTSNFELGLLAETMGDLDHYGVSSVFDYGMGELYGLVSYVDDTAANVNDTQYMVGMNYKFSKPMYVYVEYADGTDAKVAGPGGIDAEGEDFVTLGARYSF